MQNARCGFTPAAAVACCLAVSEEGDDELQLLLQTFSTGGDSGDAAFEQPQQVRVRSLGSAFATQQREREGGEVHLAQSELQQAGRKPIDCKHVL